MIDKPYIYTFYAPPGVRAKKLRGPMERTKTGFLRSIRNYRIVSAAGDYGAVTVWRRDDGQYGSAFSVWMVHRAEATHTSLKSLGAWLDTWLPKMREQS